MKLPPIQKTNDKYMQYILKDVDKELNFENLNVFLFSRL